MTENLITNILNYYELLPDTIRYKTKNYIGFKVYGTVYSKVYEKKEYLSILVRKKYVTDEDISKLNIYFNHLEIENFTLDTEIRIKLDEKDINPYLNIIKRAYDGTINEYNKKVSNIIKECIEEDKENLLKYSNDNKYAFEKLHIKFNEFNNYKISNKELDELNTDFQSLNKFSSISFLENYIDNPTKYNFIKLIYEIVSYIDVNAFDKIKYNEYP
ncbi:hypothetical protein [Clostridium tarantellae]|uniref:Uncharacterized protein n=1 Tax=Clostridium tarantellae TaxID=39493 RepID=A0A6I1MNG1_9CLOT|nr:hypothetical protein [Clostridium tarantellae]MPQ44018.1 hypothetical protein [Clostridium tarantellae]